MPLTKNEADECRTLRNSIMTEAMMIENRALGMTDENKNVVLENVRTIRSSVFNIGNAFTAELYKIKAGSEL